MCASLMENRGGFVSGVIWVVFGNISHLVSQALIVFVVARLTSPEMLGSYSYALALCGPFIVQVSIGLRIAQVTDHAERGSLGEYALLQCVAAITGVALVVLVHLLLQGALGDLLLILLVAFSKSIIALQECIYGYFQTRDNNRAIGVSQCIRSVLGIVALSAGLYGTGSIYWGIFSLVAGSLVSMVLIDVPKVPKMTVDWSAITLGRCVTLLRVAFPVVGVTLMSGITASVPRVAIERLGSLRELGLFSAAGHLLVVSGQVVWSVMQVTTSRVSRFINRRERWEGAGLLRVVLLGAIVVGLVQCMGSLAIGEALLGVVFGYEYSDAYWALVALSIASSVQYVSWALVIPVNAARKFVVQPIWAVGQVLVCCVAAVVIIPVSGVLGAGIALALGNVVQLVGALLMSKALVRDRTADFGGAGAC